MDTVVDQYVVIEASPSGSMASGSVSGGTTSGSSSQSSQVRTNIHRVSVCLSICLLACSHLMVSLWRSKLAPGYSHLPYTITQDWNMLSSCCAGVAFQQFTGGGRCLLALYASQILKNAWC